MIHMLKTHLDQYRYSEDGAGLVEYALLVALIAVLLIGAVLFLSDSIGEVFQGAGDELTQDRS